jgi:hypothetical protein
MLAEMLRNAASLLPSGQREWAEAVQAEADQVPGGWPRVFWLAGGRIVAGGALGGAVAADHPRPARAPRSWAAGLFVRF